MGLLALLTGKSNIHERPASDPPNTSRYRGVQVVANRDECCQAAEAIEGRRYLAQEVPKLPLEGCDSANCHCTYQLFDDRRTELRRASDIAYDIASELRMDDNRRENTVGRRKSDG